MQQIVISIPDNQVNFLTELLNKLNISIVAKESTFDEDNIIPQWQKDLVLSRKKNSKPEDYISEAEMMNFLDSK